MNYGKAAVAPCGHAGEHIIGNFVKCVVGCEGKPPTPHRGQPGHVHMCACKPCQIRRRATNIVLRSDRGKTVATVPWDGIANEIEFIPNPGALICHYWFMDESGDRIAAGSLEYDTFTDGRYKCVLEYKMDTSELKLKIEAAPQKMVVPLPARFALPPPSLSLSSFKLGLQTIPGIAPNGISLFQAGPHLYVDLLSTTASIKNAIEHYDLLKTIEDYCKANIAAGVGYSVVDATNFGYIKSKTKVFKTFVITGTRQKVGLLAFLLSYDSKVTVQWLTQNEAEITVPTNGYLYKFTETF